MDWHSHRVTGRSGGNRDVVYDNDRQRVPVGKVFDKGDVPVIACIGVVFGCGADFLQGVNGLAQPQSY